MEIQLVGCIRDTWTKTMAMTVRELVLAGLVIIVDPTLVIMVSDDLVAEMRWTSPDTVARAKVEDEAGMLGWIFPHFMEA